MGKLHNKKASFIEHLNPLIKHGKSQDWNLTEIFKRSEIELKRKSDFEHGRKTFTAYYFIKMLGGVDLTVDNYEKETKMKFTIEQREALQYQQYVDANKELYKKPMKDPKLHRQIKALIDSWES